MMCKYKRVRWVFSLILNWVIIKFNINGSPHITRFDKAKRPKFIHFLTYLGIVYVWT